MGALTHELGRWPVDEIAVPVRGGERLLDPRSERKETTALDTLDTVLDGQADARRLVAVSRDVSVAHVASDGRDGPDLLGCKLDGLDAIRRRRDSSRGANLDVVGPPSKQVSSRLEAGRHAVHDVAWLPAATALSLLVLTPAVSMPSSLGQNGA